jgi:hypothetical protein
MMESKEDQNLVPPIVKGMVHGMLDKKQPFNHRENRYMMLDYVHRYIGKALDEYLANKKR